MIECGRWVSIYMTPYFDLENYTRKLPACNNGNWCPLDWVLYFMDANMEVSSRKHTIKNIFKSKYGQRRFLALLE